MGVERYGGRCQPFGVERGVLRYHRRGVPCVGACCFAEPAVEGVACARGCGRGCDGFAGDYYLCGRCRGAALCVEGYGVSPLCVEHRVAGQGIGAERPLCAVCWVVEPACEREVVFRWGGGGVGGGDYGSLADSDGRDCGWCAALCVERHRGVPIGVEGRGLCYEVGVECPLCAGCGCVKPICEGVARACWR